IAHVSSVKVPVPSPSSIPTIWEEFQALTGPSLWRAMSETKSRKELYRAVIEFMKYIPKP
ncbi:hypothetical protein, partial [Acetobacter sp. DmW_125129]